MASVTRDLDLDLGVGWKLGCNPVREKDKGLK